MLVMPDAGRAQPSMSSFKLANGMQVVVIADHRAPVVTHMVWYRTGAGEDPRGKSGIAHFLEHLMFKATAKLKTGEFTRIVTRLGGRHNALTSHDTTSYFQRIAKRHLQRVMELEADRMVNVRLVEEEVRTELDVIQEERRSNVDGSPISLLNEQMLAQLYQNHPYGRPVLGWAHEIGKLTLQDAADFYAMYYAPNNALLVVAGDVTVDEVRSLAEATYGQNKPNLAVAPRARPSEPPPLATRWLRVEDGRIGAPIVLRYYLVPSFRAAKPGDAEALALLARILGGDDTSRLYRRLVLEKKIAAQSGADYQGSAMDSGRVVLLGLASKELPTHEIEAAFDEIIAEVRVSGVTHEELDRAKLALEAARVFDVDNQEKFARRIGEAVTIGRAIEDIEAEAQRVEAVTLDDIKRIAAAYLVPERSVTGAMVRPGAKPKIATSAPRR
ncbi:MAG: insulinase family protein [Rhodospirillales bacterium]|nr:insulinase family protein [Rhodospirillales bacterium]